jgi:predicted membrane protein
MIGVLAMRWNVVIGGQMFSKSLRGIMSYKMEFAGLEGWFMSGVLFCLPFVFLTVLIKLFLPASPPEPEETLTVREPRDSCAVN